MTIEYWKAGVWLSLSMKEASLQYSKCDCRRGKLIISATCQWLTTLLPIREISYWTHLPSDSFIYMYAIEAII